MEAVLHNLVRHVRIIAFDVALEHVSLGAVLPVELLQEAFQPFPRQVWPFVLLAGHVVVDKAAADSRVEDVVVQASLENAIPKVNADDIALLWVVNLEFLGFLLLVFSILKLALKYQIFFQVVQEVVRRGILPKDALDALESGIVERLEAGDLFKVSGVYRLTIVLGR